ncbi:MAG: Nramp family divalent metal transporter [Pirellulaceae bacterium]
MSDDSGSRHEGASHHTADDVITTEAPPTTVWGIARRLGPGLIVAGSIVGSGELIATTKTGAEAGFWLLWLILIGCVIKVFCQVEMGRFSLVAGKTTMFGLNEVPGPAASISATGDPKGSSIRGNWIVWYWFLMWFAGIGQLGGIVGGVGQALAISMPLTEAGRAFNTFVDDKTQLIVKESELERALQNEVAPATAESVSALESQIAKLKQDLGEAEAKLLPQLGRAEFARLGGDPEDPNLPVFMKRLGRQAYDRLGGFTHDDQGVASLAAKLGADRFRELGGEPEDPAYDQFVAMLGYGEFKNLGGNPWQANFDNFAMALGRTRFEALGEKPPTPPDEFIWAGIIAVLTSVVLVLGRYGFIQTFSTVMVASFTLITVVNLVMLQTNPSWAVSLGDIANGMSFRLPPADAGTTSTSLATALATFGIIGVGASELVTYPYWCLEKGYARFTGPHDNTPEWAARARGWMRVMHWDAWCSMFVYTFATIAFYLLGAAVLGRSGLNPGGSDLIRTLSVMYEPVFGSTAQILFLFGAFAVLYSTYFVANASHARVFSDALRVLGFINPSEDNRRRWIRLLSGLFPLLCLLFYILIPSPAELVLISGLMQAGMLPMLAIAALYFRFRRSDPRIAPTKLWDILLWISALGMGIAGFWAFYEKLAPMFLGG